MPTTYPIENVVMHGPRSLITESADSLKAMVLRRGEAWRLVGQNSFGSPRMTVEKKDDGQIEFHVINEFAPGSPVVYAGAAELVPDKDAGKMKFVVTLPDGWSHHLYAA